MSPTIDKSSSVEHVITDRKLYCKAPRFDPGGGGRGTMNNEPEITYFSMEIELDVRSGTGGPLPVEEHENCDNCHGRKGMRAYPINYLGWKNESGMKYLQEVLNP